MITMTVLHGHQIRRMDDPDQIRSLIAQPQTLLWVDVAGPTDDDIAVLRREFDFHPLAMEDVTRRHQRPKIDVYSNHYFMVVYATAFTTGQAEIELTEIDVFLGSNYVVTVHTGQVREIAEALARWERNTSSVGADVAALLYALLDGIVDEYFPLIDHLADRVETLEEAIFENFDPDALAAIFRLKKELLALRRVVAPERDVFNVLLRRDPPILSTTSMVYFNDIYDHTVRVLDSIDTYRDLLSSALDAYLSVQSNNLNEVMRRLTVISTIFLPLTFLSGFFGMNFQALPFASPFAFWLGMGLMGVVPVAMYLWFRARGWS